MCCLVRVIFVLYWVRIVVKCLFRLDVVLVISVVWFERLVLMLMELVDVMLCFFVEVFCMYNSMVGCCN